MSEEYHTSQSPQEFPRRKQHPPVDLGYKYCSICEQVKPLQEFHRDRTSADGYYAQCKVCKNAKTPRSSNPMKVVRSEEIRAKRRARMRIKREKIVSERQVNPPIPKPIKERKSCSQCADEKLLNDFPLNKKSNDGHGSYCKACAKANGRSEYAKARDREYRRDKRATDAEYRQRAQKRLNAWRKEHPEMQQELTLRRNARKRSATTERVILKDILGRDGYWCYICNQAINPDARKMSPESLTFDHIVPLQPRPGDPQGDHNPSNIKPSHKVCNARKANKRLDALTDFDRHGP